MCITQKELDNYLLCVSLLLTSPLTVEPPPLRTRYCHRRRRRRRHRRGSVGGLQLQSVSQLSGLFFTTITTAATA